MPLTCESGLALTIFGLGIAALLGHPYTGIAPPKFQSFSIPFLEGIPVIGVMFFQHDFVVYFSFVLDPERR